MKGSTTSTQKLEIQSDERIAVLSMLGQMPVNEYVG